MTTETTNGTDAGVRAPSNPLIVALAWAAVGAPLLWGVLQTLRKALALFQ